MKNGVAGESCTTAEAADGIEITCGSEKTTLKFKTCSVEETQGKDGTTGLTMTCDDGTSGTVWNGKTGAPGTNCTADIVTDKKTGKEGIQMSCGETVVGTVWNGDDGENGVSCVSTDNGDGSVEVKCGDAKAVKIFKAMCGDDAYEPAKKFCVLGKLYDKCGGKAFTINTETCIDEKVVPLCLEYKELKTHNYEFVEKRGIKDGEFCLNGIITPKCGGKEFSQHEYCSKAFDGKTDSIFTYCDGAYGPIDRLSLAYAYNELGATLTPRPVEDNGSSSSAEIPEVEEETSLFGNLIGTALQPYADEKVTDFYRRLGTLQNRCGGIENAKWCGEKIYDAEAQFCDIREDRIYKYIKIEGFDNLWWMNENLAFEYKLPKVIEEPVEGSEDVEKSIDQVMGVVNFEAKVFENYEVNGVRFYTWNSAMGIGDFRNEMSGDEIAKLIEKHRVVGACPAGWRLPSAEELKALSAMGADPNNENGFDDVGFDYKGFGLYNPNSNKVENAANAYYWSYTEDNDKQAYGLVITGQDKSEVNTTNKVYAFTVRCVTDEDPAGEN